jgi:hypothetical protein
MKLTDQQSLGIAELPEEDKPTREIEDGLAVDHADAVRDQGGASSPPEPVLSTADDLADGDVRLRLQRLEGSTQAALATLRRSLIEKALPTRDGLAREAAIAFDLKDDQQALAMIDDIAQTLGISALV